VVFASAVGSTLNRDNVRNRIVAPAAKAAGIERDDLPTLRTHDLRHTFASLLIAGGASVVFVASQMGHGSPAITLSVYSQLFDEAEHADKMAAQMEASFGNSLETACHGEARSDAVPEVTKPTQLRAVAE